VLLKVSPIVLEIITVIVCRPNKHQSRSSVACMVTMIMYHCWSDIWSDESSGVTSWENGPSSWMV